MVARRDLDAAAQGQVLGAAADQRVADTKADGQRMAAERIGLQRPTGMAVGVAGIGGDLGPLLADGFLVGDLAVFQLAHIERRRRQLQAGALVEAEDGIEIGAGRQLPGAHILGAPIVEAGEGVEALMRHLEHQIGGAGSGVRRLQGAAGAGAGKVAGQQQVAFQHVQLQRPGSADLVAILLQQAARPLDVTLDDDLVHIAFDHLDAGEAVAVDLLRRHHRLAQHVAGGGVFGGDGLGDVVDGLDRDGGPQQLLVERQEVALREGGGPFDHHALEDEGRVLGPGGGDGTFLLGSHDLAAAGLGQLRLFEATLQQARLGRTGKDRLRRRR